MRINKFIASCGVCSRRQADRLIEEGRVVVNGRKALLGDVVSNKDEVIVDGEVVSLDDDKIVVAFNKPYGVITTTSLSNDNTVMDYIDIDKRLFPIGRLDVHSVGLLLLTNDGDLGNLIVKSENKVEKEYVITTFQKIEDEKLNMLSNGVYIDGQKTLPAKVRRLGDFMFSITLIQGLNRQIRKMCEVVGYDIKILKRVRIGNVRLGNLKRGQYRILDYDEVESLKAFSS